MSIRLKALAGLAAGAGLALLTSAASAQVTVNVYNGAGTDTGSTITFSGPIVKTVTEANGFFDTSRDTIALFDPNSNKNTGTNPFALDVFGSFTVAQTGTYSFTQRSDDGSYSFLNGTPFIQIPGPTSEKGATKTASLTAGTVYNYEIRYQESIAPPGRLQFTNPQLVSTAVPEPSQTAGLGVGALGLGLLLLRARKRQNTAA
jgi:hypothetical protein